MCEYVGGGLEGGGHAGEGDDKDNAANDLEKRMGGMGRGVDYEHCWENVTLRLGTHV